MGATCQEALDILSKKKLELITIISGDKFMGYLTINSLMTGLINGEVDKSGSAEKIAVKSFTKIDERATIGQASRVLEKEQFVIVINDKISDKFIGIISQKNVYDFIINPKGPRTNGSSS